MRVSRLLKRDEGGRMKDKFRLPLFVLSSNFSLLLTSERSKAGESKNIAKKKQPLRFAGGWQTEV